MRKRANVLLLVYAAAVLQGAVAFASRAADGENLDTAESRTYPGENLWVPSLALTTGASIQEHKGDADSVLFEDMNPGPVPLRGSVDGDDLDVSAFVGLSLELMTPALPIPTSPRLFLSAEILPTFASDRQVAVEGDTDCIRGPEPAAPCARDEDGSRGRAFGQDSANGQGSVTTSAIKTHSVYAASFGAAFPVELAGRRLRIKPSLGWLTYEVDATGLVVNAACNPVARCTDSTLVTPFGTFLVPGFLRETRLYASKSRRFHGIGPGLDIEMDTGRFGPVSASIFLGGRFYYLPGDRKISFGTSQTINDELGSDVAVGRFDVEVDPWMYRTHVGIRFHWLGSAE